MNFLSILRQANSSTRLLCARFQHGAVDHAQPDLPSNLVLLGSAINRTVPVEVPPEPSPGPDTPVCRKCSVALPKGKTPVLAWLQDFANPEQRDKCVELHPNLFAAHPRMDLLHEVVQWQRCYREVDFSFAQSRAELGRGKRKPHAQKGTGLMRQGSTATAFHRNGAILHGPRGPKSMYYRMPPSKLVKGLTIALTVRRAQEDLTILDDLDLTSADQYDDVVEARDLADHSVLYVYPGDEAPPGLHQALEGFRGHNLVPLVGLSVLGVLKHDKLLLHCGVLDELERKLTWHAGRFPWLGAPHNFYKDMPIRHDKINRFAIESQEEADEG